MKKVLLVFGLIISFTYADATLCTKGDTIVFSCDIKKKKLSICKEDNHSVVYKYGTSHRVELEINTRPKYSHIQFVKANEEFHLRFHNKGYDYVVYSNELMNDRGIYKEHSGVYVVKNKNLLTKLTCKKMYPHMKGLDKIVSSIHKENYIGY